MSCLTSLISTISPLPEFIPAGVISDFRDLLDSPFPIVVFGSSAARPSDRVGSPETAGRSRMPALPSGRQSRQVWDGRRCCTRRAETAGFPLSFSPRCEPGGDPRSVESVCGLRLFRTVPAAVSDAGSSSFGGGLPLPRDEGCFQGLRDEIRGVRKIFSFRLARSLFSAVRCGGRASSEGSFPVRPPVPNRTDN